MSQPIVVADTLTSVSAASVLHAVFRSNGDATGAVEELIAAGFKPSQLSVIGMDSDSFRVATATLNSTKGNRLMMILGVVGAAMGAVIGATGVHFIPGFDATYITPVTLTTAFSGIAVGLVTGLATGAIVQIDNIPESEALVRLGTVHDGEFVVSITTKTSEELNKAQSIVMQNGAQHISLDFSTEVLSTNRTELEPALSKIA